MLANFFLMEAAFLLAIGARFLLQSQITDQSLVSELPFVNIWLVLILFTMSALTFFIWCYQKHKHDLKYESKLVRNLSFATITIMLPLYFMGMEVSYAFSALFIYASIQDGADLFRILLMPLTYTIMGLAAAWIILNRYYSVLILYCFLFIYYLGFSNTSMLTGLRLIEGQYDLWANASRFEIWTQILFFIMVGILFFVWLFNNKIKTNTML